MPILTNDVKEFIVREIACYRSPTEIIHEVEELFNVKGLETKHVVYYNPEVKTGGKLGKKWKK